MAKNNRNHSKSLDIPTQLSRRLRRFSDRPQPLMIGNRTKIFLTLSDDFSARTASELCGKEEQLKLNYSISENGQDARVSILIGRATAHRAVEELWRTARLGV